MLLGCDLVLSGLKPEIRSSDSPGFFPEVLCDQEKARRAVERRFTGPDMGLSVLSAPRVLDVGRREVSRGLPLRLEPRNGRPEAPRRLKKLAAVPHATAQDARQAVLGREERVIGPHGRRSLFVRGILTNMACSLEQMRHLFVEIVRNLSPCGHLRRGDFVLGFML